MTEFDWEPYAADAATDDPTNLTDPVSEDELIAAADLYVADPAVEGAEGLPRGGRTMTGSIAQMKAFVRQLTQHDIGYDQWNRWSFFKGGKLVGGKTAADCSSMCGAISSCYGTDLTGTFYTGNFTTKLKAVGFEVFRFVSTEQMRDGDFVVAPGKHVEFQHGARDGLPGVWWYSARNDENGGRGGGRPGHQGGRENVGWGRPYDMSRGGSRDAWIVRPPDSKAPSLLSTLPKGPKGTLRRGGPKRANSVGTRVFAAQKRLNAMGYELDEDGVYGLATERAVKDFQRRRGFAPADIDGQWGQQTGDESLRARAEGWTINPPAPEPEPAPIEEVKK